MAHDYGKEKNRKKPAKKNQRTPSLQPQLPGWVLFGSGVVFTLFGQFLYHLATTKPEQNPVAANSDIAAEVKPEPKKPTINFYNQLKDMDVPATTDTPAQGEPVTGEKKATVPISESQPAQPKTTDKAAADSAAKAAAKPAFNQMLQAGSYKTQADADEQRAKLTLLGVKAGIEVKPNPEGGNFYRVMIGPFTSASELEKARHTLGSNNVPTITVKR